MEGILRKHVLSEYASISRTKMITKSTLDTASMEVSDPDEFISFAVGPTRLTESMEASELDEFIMSGPTQITKTIEISDPDGFVMADPTYLTHAEENADPDEMKIGLTKNTHTIEAPDEDEFLLM